MDLILILDIILFQKWTLYIRSVHHNVCWDSTGHRAVKDICSSDAGALYCLFTSYFLTEYISILWNILIYLVRLWSYFTISSSLMHILHSMTFYFSKIIWSPFVTVYLPDYHFVNNVIQKLLNDFDEIFKRCKL